MSYRKKPVEVEAIQFTGDDSLARIHEFIDVEFTVCVAGCSGVRQLMINTLEGVMSAQVGDYIIRGVAGEFYPCKPDVFKKTYESVE